MKKTVSKSFNRTIEIAVRILERSINSTSQNLSGAKRENENFEKIPLILAGDFNINFADKKPEPLLPFLLEEFDLKKNNVRYNLQQNIIPL